MKVQDKGNKSSTVTFRTFAIRIAITADGITLPFS